MTDQWDRKTDFGCDSCMFYVPKFEHAAILPMETGSSMPEKGSLMPETVAPACPEGRCRHNAPTLKGYPVVFFTDWCGQHKRGSNPVRDGR